VAERENVCISKAKNKKEDKLNAPPRREFLHRGSMVQRAGKWGRGRSTAHMIVRAKQDEKARRKKSMSCSNLNKVSQDQNKTLPNTTTGSPNMNLISQIPFFQKKKI
jgi:hypothetical protein